VPNLVLTFVSQLESHRDIYEGYVPMEYSQYLEKVSQYAIFLVHSFYLQDFLGVISLIIFPYCTWTGIVSGVIM
jgi:hypothetical protein